VYAASAAASSHLVASAINFNGQFQANEASCLEISSKPSKPARLGKCHPRPAEFSCRIDEQDRERERGGGRGEERRVVIILIREYNAWSRRVPLSRAVDRIVSPAFRDFGAARRSIQPASRKPRYICPIRSVPRSFMRVARTKRRQAGRFVNANLDPHGRRLTRFRWLLSRLRASVPPRERPFEPRYEHQRVTARRYEYPDSGGGVRVERRRRHPDRTDAWRL
jgi:hypothetical protein